MVQTRHGPNPNNNIAEDHTREQRPKRQDRRLSSTIKTKTTSKNLKNARSSYDSIVGMSVLVVTLVIMIFWGRFCAILCTSAWLYFIPRLRNNVVVNDDDIGPKVKSNDIVDLDSEEYKKKVIMEGLLGRNNRGNIWWYNEDSCDFLYGRPVGGFFVHLVVYYWLLQILSILIISTIFIQYYIYSF